jgi:DNA mismatch repair protein MutL
MIELLPVEVRDQIAAGEVVERPAHMVKELVENSLDAGSTRVTVKVKLGGRSVEIIDNGHGIAADQLGLALDRFATSKIKTSDDLWKLKTYGFRGEALASLAAVSHLTLISRANGAKQASQIKSIFGQKSPVDQVSGDQGTRIIVENLFENVPARLKFLKSEAAEHQAIKNVMKAMAMTRPQVEFQYFENDRLVLLYPSVKTQKERVEQVLEISKLHSAMDKTNDGWEVEIYFTAPDQVAKTAKNIWIFVQDRHVQDRALQTALVDAYRSLLMHGEYPISVVKLKVPEDQVDVNIHPTKSQVKFLEPSQAFRFVHHTLRDELEKAPWLMGKAPTQNDQFASNAFEPQPEPLKFQDQAFHTASYRKKDYEWTPPTRLEDFKQAAAGRENQIREVLGQNTFETQPTATAVKTPGVWSRLQVIGQVGLTYIVTQDESKVVLVDQHAAHERVAFERLMRAWNGGQMEIQEFLFPLALDLSTVQVESLMQVTDSFQKLGVTIERLGPSTVGVKSAPSFVKEGVFAQILEKTADEISERGGSFQFEKKVVDICATLACHSVVRAGQALSIPEMKSLLEQMDEFPLSSFCPHGRPVSIEWTFDKLEKDFGRRV